MVDPQKLKELIVKFFETKESKTKQKLLLWMSHMFIVTPKSTTTS